MPDIDITINSPVLLAGQKFKTRYRELPAGVWSANVDRTNATFTLTGLTAGKYELEVILVLADETECAATLRGFEVVDPVACIDFTAEIVQTASGLYNLQINYSIPSPVYNPACGWKIQYGSTVVNYATLPTPPIVIPVQNVGMQVKVTANGCNGNEKDCFNADVPEITPTCTPMTITGAEVIINGTFPGGYTLTIKFTGTQSSPPTQWLTVLVNQINVLSGTPGQASYPTFTYGPIPTVGFSSFYVSLLANNNVFGSLLEFNWLIVDACNVTHTGYVSKLL